ncbi:MAG TPA: YkvA family protein [Pseudolysinimonas sp.]|nr:YkvA family protein [Pseudolysinimonas sp.]
MTTPAPQGNGRRTLAAVLIGIAALVYGVSPLDLAPEAILGPLGLLDDAGVLVGAGIAIWKLLAGQKK